jgi:hypothetical protein
MRCRCAFNPNRHEQETKECFVNIVVDVQGVCLTHFQFSMKCYRQTKFSLKILMLCKYKQDFKGVIQNVVHKITIGVL